MCVCPRARRAQNLVLRLRAFRSENEVSIRALGVEMRLWSQREMAGDWMERLAVQRELVEEEEEEEE